MFIELKFTAKLLSCKSTDYNFDGKTVTGYKIGIMTEDGDCGMVKCTADAVPDDIKYLLDYDFVGQLNTDHNTFKVQRVLPI